MVVKRGGVGIGEWWGIMWEVVKSLTWLGEFGERDCCCSTHVYLKLGMSFAMEFGKSCVSSIPSMTENICMLQSN